MRQSELLSRVLAGMESLEKRLVRQELLISKDLLCSLRGCQVVQRRIDLTLDAMSRSLVDLQDRIENIVARLDYISSMVTVPPAVLPGDTVMASPVMNPLEPSVKQQEKDDLDWVDSLMNDPDWLDSTDIYCPETIYPGSPSWIDLKFSAGGITDVQAQASPGVHMKSVLEHTSKIQEQNGGTVTSSKEKSSSTTLVLEG